MPEARGAPAVSTAHAGQRCISPAAAAAAAAAAASLGRAAGRVAPADETDAQGVPASCVSPALHTAPTSEVGARRNAGRDVGGRGSPPQPRCAALRWHDAMPGPATPGAQSWLSGPAARPAPAATPLAGQTQPPAGSCPFSVAGPTCRPCRVVTEDGFDQGR
ncbi:homeobox protein Hox-A13-like [Schistocerca serialis cubense]|uniref:homeobox protein Hox-A13-like n=1 Tax=Schistocerca serialis cubense TaxID=2023355 RepID=UPI00214E8B5F|nr:homeobox protein Hox-A13-like [Schistocerca serialis cubense]